MVSNRTLSHGSPTRRSRHTAARVLVFGLTALPALAQNQLWTRQLGTSADDRAFALASDGSDGIYFGGQTLGALGGTNAGGNDAWFARYGSTGNALWSRQLGTASSEEAARTATSDGTGGLYVSGFTGGNLGGTQSGGVDIWLARYDGSGNQTWIRQFGSSTGEEPDSAAPDGSGGVYLSGFTVGNLVGTNAGFYDGWLARYDSAGNQLWVRQFGTSGLDRVYAVAADGSGGAYVSGVTGGSFGGPSAGGYDPWLARFDGAGNQLWIRQIGTGSDETTFDAAPDGSGGAYVCGRTRGSLGAPNAGGWDAWLARYDSAGNQLWIHQLGTPGDDQVNAAASDGSGGLHVVGDTSGDLGAPQAGSGDAWLARYDGAGNQLWVDQLGTSAGDGGVAAAHDGSGGLYLGGTTGGGLGGAPLGGSDAWLARHGALEATRYCTPATPNSTAQWARVAADGSNLVTANDLTLSAERLPSNSFGYFLTSQTRDLVVGAGGSQGDLCLGGMLGRFNGPGQVMSSGSGGALVLSVNLSMMPTPMGTTMAQPGQTWNFQAWYRDANPGATSNFTDAVGVLFH
jgi:hypothetical protein